VELNQKDWARDPLPHVSKEVSEPKRYEVLVTVRIGDRAQYGSPGLTVEDRFLVDAADFMSVAKILGQFHDLSVKLAAQ